MTGIKGRKWRRMTQISRSRGGEEGVHFFATHTNDHPTSPYCTDGRDRRAIHPTASCREGGDVGGKTGYLNPQIGG